MKQMRPLPLFAALALAALPAGAQSGLGSSALKGHDNRAPIDINAQRIEVRDLERQAIFTGDVAVSQGAMTLDAARIRVFYERIGTDLEIRRLDADVLLPFFGLAMNLGPIADWGLDLAHSHIAVRPETCASSVPGIHAIGDIATYPGKLKLILSGFAEAAAAAHAIRERVFPGEVHHFEYSTTQGVPGLAA